MRKYKCTDLFGDIVDLDDQKTYKHLPTDLKELRNMMFKEIGYYYCYTHFWHRNVFLDVDSDQMKRADKIIKNFTDNEKQNYENVMWYQEHIFLFQDEVENMC